MIINDQINNLLKTIDFIIKNIKENQNDTEFIQSVLESSVKIIMTVRDEISSLVPIKTANGVFVKSEDIIECLENDKVSIKDNDNHEELSEYNVEESETPVFIQFSKNDYEDGADGAVKSKPVKKVKYGRLKCELCSKSFSSNKALDTHEEEHFNNGIYTCTFCDYYSPARNEVVKHNVDVHISIYPCGICTDMLRSYEDAKKHYKDIHNTVVEQNTCCFCNKTCDWQIQLKRHIDREHNTNKQKCYKCAKVFNSTDELLSHLENSHNEKEQKFCSVCDYSCFSNISLKKHMEEHLTVTELVCKICGKKKPSESKLKAHISNAHGVKKHLCPYCPHKEIKMSNLKKHIKTHTGETSFKCGYCNKGFYDKRGLDQHEFSQHTNPEARPHKCDYCGKGFKSDGNLRNHVKIHKGEYARKCEICDKKFVQAYNHKLHMLKSHQIST